MLAHHPLNILGKLMQALHCGAMVDGSKHFLVDGDVHGAYRSV